MNTSSEIYQEFQEESLLDARRVQYTLTGDELYDNVIFVIAFQFAIYFEKDVLARLVFMQPRKWITGTDYSNSLEYLAQARIALQDNFNRRIWHGFSGNVHPAKVSRYAQRNHKQFALVIFAGVASFLFDVMANSLGLPRNRIILGETEKLMRWRSLSPKEGRMISNPNDLASFASPVLDGANLNPDAYIYRCSAINYEINDSIAGSAKLQIEPYNMTIIDQESRPGLSGMVHFILRGDIGLTAEIHRTALVQNGQLVGHFEFVSSADELSENFYKNAKFVEAQTGIVVSKPSRIDISSEVRAVLFRVDATNVSWKPSLPRTEYYRFMNVHNALDSILHGTYAYNGEGSRILRPRLNQTFDIPELFAIENREVVIAKYTGTVLPAFGAIILAAVLLVVDIVAKVCLKGPPGLGWEVITAHGRKCADKLLTGPTATRTITWCRQEGEEKNCYVGYGVPPGFYPVDEFQEGDEVGAAAFDTS